MNGSTTSAAVLAGGRARRFDGRDKSRLAVDGRPIIVRQVEVLQRVASEIFVVGGDPQRFADLGLTVYEDVVPDAGPIGGVLTAMERAREDRVIVVACDLPFLDERVLRALAELADRGDGAWVTTERGVEPLLACYRRQGLERLRAALRDGLRKAADLGSVLNMIALEGASLAALGAPDRLVENVNSPQDYARVQYRSS